ncbi:MAG: hypothetical protein JW751_21410 [Polyangiaceae bacterium]|nr:hypothetical protein [Polyangiaceae bacterium]
MADDRLLDTSNVALERELIRAAAEEGPPPSVRRRGLAALGLLAVATPAAAAPAALAAAGAGKTPGAAGLLGWNLLFKWGMVAAMFGGAAVGGAVAFEGAIANSPPNEPTPVVHRASDPEGPGHQSQATPGESGPTRVQAEEDRAEALAAPPGHSPATAAPATRPPRGTSGASSIREEIDLIDRARANLASGAPDRALAVLRDYSARHPRGELREEAAVVRIEALRAKGDERAASAAVRRFERRFPASAHQDRVLDGGTR